MLHRALTAALDRGDFENLIGAEPANQSDALNTLLLIHDLWLAPTDVLGDRVRFQHHPVVADLKWRLERHLLDQLLGATDEMEPMPVDPCEALRRIARRSDDAVYDWVATSATWEQVVMFLAIEGGPDAGFDDLVALCQVGIRGEAKIALADNYWDEMGRGDVAALHSVLHDRLVAAVDMPVIPRTDLPISALYRQALNGLLATNRCLQPELIGALGLIELQAGPRCRRVVRAFDRLGAPADAYPFYMEHASVDPIHGRDWLDHVVVPTVLDKPEWAERIVRGAQWRAHVNARLFDNLQSLLSANPLPQSA
jgi:hypothetical protein